MGTHPDAVFDGQLNGPVHHQRVARMPSASDVGRGDVADDLGIHAQVIGAETLPHVAVKVDLFHDVSPEIVEGYHHREG